LKTNSRCRASGGAALSEWRQFSYPAIVAGLTVMLILVPLATLVLFSFRSGTPWDPGPFTLDNYELAYSNSLTYVMFGNTLILAFFGTVLSVVIAVFFAFLTERTDMPFRNLAWGLMLLPMAIPGLLYAMSWTFLLSPNIGFFNIVIRDFLSLFGHEGTTGPFNVYSLSGMILLEGFRGVTATFLIMVGAFRAMDPNLEEAARMSGASNTVTFYRIFLPLLAPAILAAGMFTFMSHLESLDIPLVIGLPAKIFVFPSYIYFTTQRASPPEFGLSAALGASFLVMSVFLVWWYRRVVGQTSRYATVTGKGYRSRLIPLGNWRYPCLVIFVVYFLITIAAPVLVLAWSSLLPFYMPPAWDVLEDLSLTHYYAVFRDRGIVGETLNTITVALLTATITMTLSLLTAWMINRRNFTGRGLLDGITFLPQALPGVIVGIALTFVFVQQPLSQLGLFGTVWPIVLGLTITYIAFGSRTMMGAFAQLHQELEEAAATSGARVLLIIRRIVMPLLLPSLISGWIWVASRSLRDFSIPLMLSTRDSRVLSVTMWHKWADGYAGQTAALGVMLIFALAVITIVGRLVVNRLSRQQET
jgi:iron(III) transport system permease protein